MGVKAFSKSPSPMVPDCDFRVSQECLSLLLPSLSKRRVNVNKSDAVTIISEENPFTDKLTKTTQAKLKALSPGSTMFVFSPTEEEPSPACDIIFCGWRGKTSIRCFGSRCDRAHFLMLLGEDLNEINKRVAEKKAAKAQQKHEEGKEKAQQAEDDLPPLNDSGDEAKNEKDKDGGTKAENRNNQDEEDSKEESDATKGREEV